MESIKDIGRVLNLVSHGFGMFGTKKKYVEELTSNGINNPNTAVFGIDNGENLNDRQQFYFTILMSIYHAISLEVQSKIREGQYQDFVSYYEDHPEDTPSILLLDDEMPRKVARQGSSAYAMATIPEIKTVSYGKIEKFGAISPEGIIRALDLTVDDIRTAQSGIDFAGEIQGTDLRFFIKAGADTIEFPSIDTGKTLPDELMLSFCSKLADILVCRMREGLVQLYGNDTSVLMVNYGNNNSVNFPAGIASISGYLNGIGLKSSYVDMQNRDNAVAATLELIRERSIKVLGISAHPGSLEGTSNVIESIEKEMGEAAPFIVVGHRIVSVRENVERLMALSNKVYIARGEGELAMKDFVLRVMTRDLPEDRDVSVLRLLSPGEFPEILPNPDQRYDIALVESSRGCGYGICSFCKRLDGNGNTWRRIPNDILLKNIEAHLRNGHDYIYFIDEEFFSGERLDREKLDEIGSFIQAVQKSGLNFRFRIQTRASTLVNSRYAREIKEILNGLKKIGLSVVFLGAESFSNTQLQRYKKGITASTNLEAVFLLYDLGIEAILGFIPLDPLVTMEEIEDNIEFLENNSVGGKPLYNFTPNLATPLSIYHKSTYEQMLNTNHPGLITGFDPDRGEYLYQFQDKRLAAFSTYYRDSWYEPFQSVWRKIKQAMHRFPEDTNLRNFYYEYNSLNFEYFKALYQFIKESLSKSSFEYLLKTFTEAREKLLLKYGYLSD
ncbi:MAG: radical SAM protein [Candidatus Gracilibacteria bacterium]